MKFKTISMIVAAVTCMTLAAAELIDTPINLLKEREFKPVYMHGMVTAAKGWLMHDGARERSIRKDRVYLSGEECFTLSHKDGVFSIIFKKPLKSVYKNNEVLFRSNISTLVPPADHYVYKGRVKFKNGELRLRPGRRFKATGMWRTFEVKQKVGFANLILRPKEGAEYHFASMEEYAVYPKIGGTIDLPDGGKLEKILIPENPTYEMRHGLALWRGWLWRLTGVALPIVTVKEITGPVEGALVAVKGPEKPGNWSLKVDKNGVVISSYCDLEIRNALFDYLRRGLGCAFYQRDCQKVPAMGSVKALTAIDYTSKLLYTHFNPCNILGAMQGCDDATVLYTRNDVNYYHLFSPKSDHVFNVLVPQERYFKTNPEYFAKTGPNSYNVRENPFYTNHCMTNPDFLELLLKNAVEYAKAQYGPRRLVIDEGDSPIHCLCERCVKFNNGTESCSNAVYAFHEKLAKRIAEVRPDLIVERHSYSSRKLMPDNIKKLSDNSALFYCLGSTGLFNCKLHVDCEINRRALKLMKDHLKLVGNDRRRFSFMHYSDLRPMYMVKQMTELNKLGSDSYFIWVYKSYHPAIPFLLGRYNLGEDPVKLLKEFEEAYYGKGAPYVHQVFEIAEEFAENYKHSPTEIKTAATCSIWPDAFGGAQTILNRKTLDRIYPCFEKALEAAGNDRDSRKHICRDLLFFLLEDLHKFRPANCKTDAEFKAYIDRFALLVRIGKEFPGEYRYLMHKTDPRVFLNGVTGVAIPRTKSNWADEPILQKIISEPDKYLSRSGEYFPGQGLYFKPNFFTSNFENTVDVRPEVKVGAYPRDNMLLYPTQVLDMTLPMKKLSKRPVALSIEAVKQSQGGSYSIEVAVNGHKVYSGPAAYAHDKWSRMGFSIPAKALKLGDNHLTVKNTSIDGWIAVSEIYTIDPSADFQSRAAGGDGLWNHLRESADDKGSTAGGNGKVRLETPAGTSLSWYFFNNAHNYPKIAVTPGGKVKIEVTASGSGKMRLAIFRYKPYGFDHKGQQLVAPNGYIKNVGNCGERRSREFILDGKSRKYKRQFTLPANTGLIIPGVILEGGKVDITDVRITVSQPEFK